MLRLCKFISMMLFAVSALSQTADRKYPPAIPAGDMRSEICSPEPNVTPLPTWKPGSLKVDMTVGSNGKVVELQVLDSSYTGEQTEAAVAVLKQWIFKPAYLRGYFVTYHFTLEITATKNVVTIRIPEFEEQRGCRNIGYLTY